MSPLSDNRRKVSTSSHAAPQNTASSAAKPSRPRKKLPCLPKSYSGISADNPEQHGGRVRARPFVDGDYYAHVYVERELKAADVELTTVDVSDELSSILDKLGQAVEDELGVRVHSLLSSSEPTVEDTAESEDGELPTTRRTKRGWRKMEQTPALHVSLSHPLPLRRPLSQNFPGLVAQTLRDTPAFSVGLAWPPKVYNNAPKHGPKRAFLALRTSAGTREMGTLLEKVDGLLKKEHLPTYHEDPEFHTSFAWWLDTEQQFDVGGLERHKEEVLTALKGGWRITHVCVKVAKTVTRIPLRE